MLACQSNSRASRVVVTRDWELPSGCIVHRPDPRVLSNPISAPFGDQVGFAFCPTEVSVDWDVPSAFITTIWDFPLRSLRSKTILVPFGDQSAYRSLSASFVSCT